MLKNSVVKVGNVVRIRPEWLAQFAALHPSDSMLEYAKTNLYVFYNLNYSYSQIMLLPLHRKYYFTYNYPNPIKLDDRIRHLKLSHLNNQSPDEILEAVVLKKPAPGSDLIYADSIQQSSKDYISDLSDEVLEAIVLKEPGKQLAYPDSFTLSNGRQLDVSQISAMIKHGQDYLSEHIDEHVYTISTGDTVIVFLRDEGSTEIEVEVTTRKMSGFIPLLAELPSKQERLDDIDQRIEGLLEE